MNTLIKDLQAQVKAIRPLSDGQCYSQLEIYDFSPLFERHFDCPASGSVFLFPNTGPDPGQPFQYGSTWIWIRIRNTVKKIVK